MTWPRLAGQNGDDPMRFGAAPASRRSGRAESGFQHGGWHLPYFDDISRRWVVESCSGAWGFILGRHTYETLAAYWPNASEEEQGVVQGDVPQAVRGLKEDEGKDLHVMTTGAIITTYARPESVSSRRS